MAGSVESVLEESEERYLDFGGRALHFLQVLYGRVVFHKHQGSPALIRTGFPSSDITFKYFSRAISSDGVRYCLPWAAFSFEGRPRAR
jgi:hypothetical protein